MSIDPGINEHEAYAVAEAFAAGRAMGHAEARDAVAALDHTPRCELAWGCECSERHPMECTCNRDAALAAIDALRGES